MMTLTEVVVTIGRIERTELVRWVELGWVVPSRLPAEPSREADFRFSDMDLARVRMIADLRHDLEIEEETMPLVLSLLDQMYALRRQVRALTGAIRQQPDQIRSEILARLRSANEDNRGEG